MNKTTVEQVEEFYRFLTGDKIPDSIHLSQEEKPKLTKEQAFTVIWFLQEHLRIIPDNYERCKTCGGIHDSNCEGFYVDQDTVIRDPESDIAEQKVDEQYYGFYCCAECEPIDLYWAE